MNLAIKNVFKLDKKAFFCYDKNKKEEFISDIHSGKRVFALTYKVKKAILVIILFRYKLFYGRATERFNVPVLSTFGGSAAGGKTSTKINSL